MMTKRMIRDARTWEAEFIKRGRKPLGESRARKTGSIKLTRESRQLLDELAPHVRAELARRRFHETYSGKTPKTTTAFQTFNAAYDVALGKGR